MATDSTIKDIVHLVHDLTIRFSISTARLADSLLTFLPTCKLPE